MTALRDFDIYIIIIFGRHFIVETPLLSCSNDFFFDLRHREQWAGAINSEVICFSAVA